jgi:hypothetical protein
LLLLLLERKNVLTSVDNLIYGKIPFFIAETLRFFILIQIFMYPIRIHVRLAHQKPAPQNLGDGINFGMTTSLYQIKSRIKLHYVVIFVFMIH